jgi:uncharacterized protein YlzI (FlbEa/FlbD family)
MLPKGTTALAVLLVFGTASGVFADVPSRPDYHDLFAEHSVSKVSNDRIAAVNDATTEKDPFAASRLALLQSAFLCRGGIAGGTTVWIKLTEPGGKLILINAEHVTSVRSDTQIPGARAQLDLTSGKFQGVQENVEQVMQLISATPSARETDETPSAVLC